MKIGLVDYLLDMNLVFINYMKDFVCNYYFIGFVLVIGLFLERDSMIKIIFINESI